MYFGELVAGLGERFKDSDIKVDPFKTLVERVINQSTKLVYRAHTWAYRQKLGQIVLQPNYTTGTCSVTQFNGTNEDSARKVTFSGSSLTSNMAGRFFQVSGSSDWHKISYVDVTNSIIYLESPIIDVSASGKSFNIWKRFYYLSGDVDIVSDIGKWANRFGRLEFNSYSSIVDKVMDLSDSGIPTDFVPFGTDNYEPSYSTGTIALTKDSNVAVGTGTTFLGNVMTGDQLLVSDKTFYVKRIETNTRIILFNYATADSPDGAYEIKRNISLGFQFYPNNMSTYMTIPYAYYDKSFDMVHYTKDRPPLPDEFDLAILSRAEFMIRKDKGGVDWIPVSQLCSAELDALKNKVHVVNNRFNIFAPKTMGYPGR